MNLESFTNVNVKFTSSKYIIYAFLPHYLNGESNNRSSAIEGTAAPSAGDTSVLQLEQAG